LLLLLSYFCAYFSLQTLQFLLVGAQQDFFPPGAGYPTTLVTPLHPTSEQQCLWTSSARSNSLSFELSRICASPALHLWLYFFHFWPLIQTMGCIRSVGYPRNSSAPLSLGRVGQQQQQQHHNRATVDTAQLGSPVLNRNSQACSPFSEGLNLFFFFVWADFVSTDAECCSVKPVHSVIVESFQT